MTLSQRINVGLSKLPAWPLYLVGVLPPVWFLWLGLTGGLGVEPIKALEHRLGELALQTFIVSLLVTPLRNWTGVNLIKFRRALGLICFYYITCHLLVWLVLDVQIPSQIWADIVKRPYITIGMAGFVLMLPLIATSNNRAVRWLGPLWRRVHLLTYPVALLAAVHFIWVRKGFQLEPILYLLVIGGLLAVRLIPTRARVAA